MVGNHELNGFAIVESEYKLDESSLCTSSLKVLLVIVGATMAAKILGKFVSSSYVEKLLGIAVRWVVLLVDGVEVGNGVTVGIGPTC
jgi:hypothetical protein